MENVEEIINKRIKNIDGDLLVKTIHELNFYNVNLFNSQNKFVCKDFKNDFLKTYDLLFENDIPINGIKYQLADFMSTVQIIVGIRNMGRFLSE